MENFGNEDERYIKEEGKSKKKKNQKERWKKQHKRWSEAEWSMMVPMSVIRWKKQTQMFPSFICDIDINSKRKDFETERIKENGK